MAKLGPGRPFKFTRDEKARQRKTIIKGIRDGYSLEDIAFSLGYLSKQGMLYHFPNIRREALSKIKV